MCILSELEIQQDPGGFKKCVLFIKTVVSRIQNVHIQAFAREFLYY